MSLLAKIACAIHGHPLRCVAILSDQTLDNVCERCGGEYLSTIATGPEMVFAKGGRLGRKYLAWRTEQDARWGGASHPQPDETPADQAAAGQLREES